MNKQQWNWVYFTGNLPRELVLEQSVMGLYQTYYFCIEAFNENGIGERSEVIMVK